MATLPTADIQAVQSTYCSDLSGRREAFDVKRADLRAAVIAIDAWIDANAASFNTAIPQPARAQLSAKQKAELLLRVVRRRWEVA